jgi:hypothetical protein
MVDSSRIGRESADTEKAANGRLMVLEQDTPPTLPIAQIQVTIRRKKK